MRNKSKKAMERLSEIEKIVGKDEIAERLICNLKRSATRYVGFVANAEAEMKNFNGSDDYFKGEGAHREELGNTRRIYHNALNSNLNILNRYLFKTYNGAIPIGGIYSLLPPESIKDRNAIGDWAGSFVFGLKELQESKI
jgi:uncharacterized protein DUF3232